MNMNRSWAKVVALFGKRRLDAELDEELRFHLDAQVEENIADGMSPAEARRVALRDFGGVEATKEAHRDARGFGFLETLWKDSAYAVRGLRRDPLFTLAAVVTLALGIGANTAVFSLLDQVFFRLPPVSEPERLVSLYQRHVERGSLHSTSYPDYAFFRENTDVFTELAAYMRVPTSLRSSGFAEETQTELVSGNYFELLGIQPALGRFFRPEECEIDGANPVVVLGHEFWQSRFDGRSDIVGSSIRLHQTDFTVIGVAPPGFRGIVLDWGDQPEMWAPLAMRREVVPILVSRPDIVRERGALAFLVTGRLAKGVSVEQAQAAIGAARANLNREYPGIGEFLSTELIPLRRARFWPGHRGSMISLFGLLSAAVGLILLLACVNVGGLLAVRGLRRRKEVATRLALGAGRARMVSQLLTESLVLALPAGLAGLLVAQWTLQVLAGMYRPFGLPLNLEFGLDGRVLLFALGLSVVTAMLSGLLPLRQALKVRILDSLKPASGAAGGSLRLPGYLVTAQIAIAVVLVAGAGLFIKTVHSGENVLGIRSPETILIANLELRTHDLVDENTPGFYARLLPAVRDVPGVATAALTWDIPFGGRRSAASVWKSDPEQHVAIDYNVVTPDAFELLGVRLLRGRLLSEHDTAGSPPVAVVSERMARDFWPGEDPLGKRFHMKLLAPEVELEVVGVVRDDSRMLNVRDSTRGRIYLPLAQSQANDMTLLVRCMDRPAAVAGLLRQRLRTLDPRLPISEIRTMEVHQNRALARERFLAFLLMALGGIALLLSVTGVYAVAASAAGMRTHEIGIRMALGAQRGSLVGRELRRGAVLTLVGAGIGLTIALLYGRSVESLLFEVSAADPTVLLVAALGPVMAGLAAAWVPARKAASIDPARVLREE